MRTRGILLWALAIAAASVLIRCLLKTTSSSSFFALLKTPEEASSPASSSFFAETYVGARAAFRAALAAVEGHCGGLRVENKKNTSIGFRVVAEDGTDLTIDAGVVSFVGGAKQGDGVVVHLSGVHGVEGFAGSAIQSAVLAQWAHDEGCPPAGSRVVFVHAVNPFGFHESRRWNEGNVDLNRNVLDESGFDRMRQRPVERDYATLEALFNPAEFAEWRFWVSAVRAIAARGFIGVKRALVSGQYSFPKGLFYGGAALEASHAHVLAFLRAAVDPQARVVLIDVHTGLGPRGVDTLIALGGGSAVEDARRAFGEPVGFFYGGGTDRGGAAAGYDACEGSTARYADRLGWRRALVVAQEFGTVPGLAVARALVRENAAWHHSGDHQERAAARQSLRGAFDLQGDATWRRPVLDRGARAVADALRALHTTPDFPSPPS